eukprot:TRINITY_DN2116_c0_g2_i2.p1 TRINITY_DN2116_c0_g2~~TRINITY_DN2116_c0_g2_i2.p1  ORF type:complete len:448 (+),score=103.63 TRINITY_DN2116_c0_g2_i2:145-1488(+)
MQLLAGCCGIAADGAKDSAAAVPEAAESEGPQDTEDGSSDTDSELGRQLAGIGVAAVQLRLELLIEPSGRRVVVDLPCDASVAELRAAAHEAGGLRPGVQQLTIGGWTLVRSDATLLSATGLIRQGARVVVGRRDLRRLPVSFGVSHGLALLDGGTVGAWGDTHAFEPLPDFGGCVQSVHAGFYNCAAVVEGRLAVWGSNKQHIRDVDQLRGKQVVCCSMAVNGDVVAAVDSDGWLHFCGVKKHCTPARAAVARMQGRVAAVSMYDYAFFAVMTLDGTAAMINTSGKDERDDLDLRMDLGIGTPATVKEVTELDLGGRAAVSVSAGYRHCIVLLDDGSVRCFGENSTGQCDVPPDLPEVAACAAGGNRTAVCCADGMYVRWGNKWNAHTTTANIAAAGPCVAVGIGDDVTCAVTADGRVVCDGEQYVERDDPKRFAPKFGGRKVAWG